ncbi:MAG: glycosyltransferase [Kiritimatiellales bacterium]|nr:glycosyltransferase [Kiritimatiellales bacterium]
MKVSIVMPVYNAEATVSQALESLTAQTFQPLEIIVVNDGSTDGTFPIIGKAAERNPRITILNRPHRGIVPALNAGLAAASGKYIARMDADDISHPERIAKQVAYLDKFPDTGMVGCRVGFGGDREKQAGYANYVDWINQLVEPEDIALNRFVESPFAHPSVMFRRELVEKFGGYRDGLFPEDYELWLRWMGNGVKVAKVDEVLLDWSDPPNRLSRTDARYRVEAFYQTKAKYLFQWLEKHNPHHPDIIVWGAGRVTRKRVAILNQYELRITQYVDIRPRKIGVPVIQPLELPDPSECFVLPMVGKRGAREIIREFLHKHGFTEGIHCIFAA